MRLDIVLQTGSVDSAAPIIGLGKRRAELLEGQFKDEAYELDGCSAILRVRGDKAVLIINCAGGVAIHPRVGAVEPMPYTENGVTKFVSGVKGGFKNGTELLSDALVYPLVDEDNATFSVLKDGETYSGDFAGDSGNYGNLYWWNGADTFYSWKGAPTRHCRIPSDVNISGFSESNNVYQGGAIYATAPSGYTVLGVCEDAQGTFYSACEVNDGTIYTALCRGTTFELITRLATGREGLPYFADALGIKFTCPNGRIVDIAAGTISDRQNRGEGVWTENRPAVHPAFSVNFAKKDLFESDRYGSFLLSGSITSSSQGTTANTVVFKGSFPLVYDPRTPPLALTFSGGTEAPVVGQPFNTGVTGGQGVVVVTYTGFTVRNGVVTSITGCGQGTVQAQDSCGATITRQVRLPVGVWSLVGDVGSYSGTTPPQEYISGGTKIVEYYECACHAKANTKYVGEWINGSGCCDKSVVVDYTLYSPTAGMYPIGATQIPTLEAICASQAISCGDGALNTVTYWPCTGNYNDGVSGCNAAGSTTGPDGSGIHTYNNPTGFAKANPLRRLTYTWVCP